jgi:3-hydroxyisobutyrate dehydrogenase
MTANTTVAVIGLGAMGFGMAQSLIRAGFNVVGCDVSAERVEGLRQQGGVAALTPARAAEGADVVVTVVVSGAQSEQVLFGPDGAVNGLAAGGVVISCATMDPDTARSLAARTEAAGRHYVDAPISGGAARAVRGELTILAAGPEEAFAKARPVMEAMSTTLHDLGREAGLGAAFKMINQLLAGVHIAVACEAIAFAGKQGLDLEKVYEVITGAAGNSWMFENRVPHILSGDYKPLSAVDIFVKDLGIIQDMARTARFPVPVSAAALQMFLATSGAGMGRDDDSSVARTYANLAGVTLP